jgi:hypothetical protein
MKLHRKNFASSVKSIFNESEVYHPVSNNPLHGVITPEILANLRDRNDARLKQTLRAMGNKWICHPDNHVQRYDGKEYK